MVVYEVNLTLDKDVVDEFRGWLDAHIQEMLTFPGFKHSKLMKVEEKSSWQMTVWYFVETRSALEAYFQGEAARMREEGLARFGGRFTASRRILEVLEER